MKKTTKYAYIKQDPWGAYRVSNDGETVARSLTFDEAEAVARKVAEGKTIKVIADWGTMTLR